MIEIFCSLAAVVVTIIVIFLRKKFSYWNKQENVARLPLTSLFGHYGANVLQKKCLAETVQDICKQMPDEPFIGAYFLTEPVLIPQDPELLKIIMAKDFYYFCNRELAAFTYKEVMTRNLFYNHGDQWKVARQNLTPLFSSAKMKNMFHLIEKCSRQFEKLLDEQTKNTNIVNMKVELARFTMDCICSCAFGIDSNVMGDKYGTNGFTKLGNAVFEVPASRGVKVLWRRIFPTSFYMLGMQLFPQGVYNFFHSILTSVFKKRNYEPSNRQDFVDLILTFYNNKQIVGDKMKSGPDGSYEKATVVVDDAFLIAQCQIFFSAGYETSSSTSAFVLYEMAKHPDVMKKAQQEVDKYLSTRKHLNYDCVTELPYLYQCVEEAMRLYPVLGVIPREVYEDYTFPNGVKVEKGTRVHLPIYHIHRSPKYWEDPDTFNPERFSPEERSKITPYTYFPFGEGPRICIGLRFAKMQVMAGLITVLKKYNVELAENTPKEMEFYPRALVLQSNFNIDLVLTPREGWEGRVYTDDVGDNQ